MKRLSTLSSLSILLLLTGCASTPAQQKAEESQKPAQQQLPALQPVMKEQQTKTIVPDINEAGQRGEIARAILARSSARFLEADENRDYRISLDEAEQHLPHVSRSFSRYDSNGDGGISWQEYLGHDQWPAPVHGN